MQKITPYMWFDHQAEEAANFYISAFDNSKINYVSRYEEAGAEVSGMSEGTVMAVEFELEGQVFIALNGGPVFTFSPAISFFVNCKTIEEVDRLWEKLSGSGIVLMERAKYPFSERFGWLQDKYGVSWQINLGSRSQKITPFYMFVGEQCGKAEEAINFYLSLFENSSIDEIERYGIDEEYTPGSLKSAIFSIDGQEFRAINSSFPHGFTFTEAISLFVNCETQEEVDLLWDSLSAGGEIQQCGWLIDKYGVTWQIIPQILGELLSDPDPEKSQRVMKAMLQMQKIDSAKLKQAYDGI